MGQPSVRRTSSEELDAKLARRYNEIDGGGLYKLGQKVLLMPMTCSSNFSVFFPLLFVFRSDLKKNYN